MKLIKKYIKEITFVVVILIVSAIVFFIGKKLNIAADELNNIVQLLFDGLMGLVAIWISGYFILIQLYKNTYPMEIIEKTFLKKVKVILIFSIVNILLGILVLTIFNDIISTIYYIILFILNMFVIFCNTYMINRTFTINTYIEEYFKTLENDLEKDILDKNKIDKVFSDIYKLFDECLVKEEYYVCNNITEKNGSLFQKLIEHCNKLLISDDKEKQELAEYILKKIIKSGIYQINAAKNLENKRYLVELFKQQEKNIKICLKIKNVEWFKKYVDEINKLANEYNDEEILENLYSMNINIGEYLLKEENTYFEWYIQEIYHLNMSLKYLYSNLNLKYVCKLLIGLLIIDSDENNSLNYDILKKILSSFTKEITYGEKDIQDVVIYYQLYGSEIIDNKDLDKVKDFIKIITHKNNRIIDNERWNGFILFYLNITSNEWDELGKDNRKLIVDMILDLVLKDSKNVYFGFMPDYKEIVFKNRYNTNIINDICDEIKELLIRLMINNNVNMFYYVLKEFKKAIVDLEKSDRNIQEKLFDICMNILSRTINIKNKEFIEITISTVDEIIEELDKERKISDKFGKKIIEEIAGMIIYRHRIDEYSVINLIYLLDGFLEEGKEYNFVSQDNTKKKILYKSIYNIGVGCIEDDRENAVRTVSNSLGWFIIRSIDNDNNELSNYLIERTIDLFRIAQNMQVSEKTLIFIMTLFTTVGTYCCKDIRYQRFLDKILDVLKNEEYIRIKTAIELRTNENTMWDKLYNNRTKELTKKFLNQLKNKTEN